MEKPDPTLLPQNLEAEQALLGAVLANNKAFERISEFLKPQHFADAIHSKIYEVIAKLIQRGHVADVITLKNYFEQEGTLNEVGGHQYLVKLADSASPLTNAEYYAQFIYDKYLRRELINTGYEIVNEAMKEDLDSDATSQIEMAEKKLFDLSNEGDSQGGFTDFATALTSSLSHIEAAYQKDGKISGLPTQLDALDNKTGGLNNSDLIIIAGRPAMGKTAFVLSMAKNIAVNFRNPVALFSLEMSNVQLVNRLISNVCEIPSEKIKSGQLAAYEWQQLDYKLKDLLDAPLYVDDTPSLSVFELRTKARRLVREHGVRIIIIDYLQMMNASGMAYGRRLEEVSTISRSLKGLAKELNIPIIALSQLNRGVESREGLEGKRPQLSDLRESGAIEQDADMVCFIHRPEYYKIFQDDKGNDLRGMAEIIIAKHRNGAVGDVLLRFKGEYTRFQNPDDDMVIPLPDAGAMLGSRMNNTGTVPPPPAEFAPQNSNPFGGGNDGPLPF